MRDDGINEYLFVKEIADRGSVRPSDDLAPPGVPAGWVTKTVDKLSKRGTIRVVDGESQVTDEGRRSLARMERVLALVGDRRAGPGQTGRSP